MKSRMCKDGQTSKQSYVQLYIINRQYYFINLVRNFIITLQRFSVVINEAAQVPKYVTFDVRKLLITVKIQQ